MAAGQELEDISGAFLYEIGSTGADDIRILARVVEADAAFQLSRMLKLEAA